MLKEGQPGFRHWGSSLSLESDDPGLTEITRRTLREGRAMAPCLSYHIFYGCLQGYRQTNATKRNEFLLQSVRCLRT